MGFSVEKLELPGVYGQKPGFFWKNGGFHGFMVGNWGFSGKIGVFLKNGVFVGFWSRIRGKVGKSREFDDFLKIGENREK